MHHRYGSIRQKSPTFCMQLSICHLICETNVPSTKWLNNLFTAHDKISARPPSTFLRMVSIAFQSGTLTEAKNAKVS